MCSSRCWRWSVYSFQTDNSRWNILSNMRVFARIYGVNLSSKIQMKKKKFHYYFADPCHKIIWLISRNLGSINFYWFVSISNKVLKCCKQAKYQKFIELKVMDTRENVAAEKTSHEWLTRQAQQRVLLSWWFEYFRPKWSEKKCFRPFFICIFKL